MMAIYALTTYSPMLQEVPLEEFPLFSFDYSLEKAKARFPNNSWNEYKGQIWNKNTKKFDLTESCIWSTVANGHVVLIRKT